MAERNTAALYGIKLARLLLMYSAISIAVRMSEADYVERVYGRGESPPPLSSVILTIAAFIVVFDALLLAVLRALGDIDKSAVLASSGFRKFVMVESFVYTAFVLGVGYWVMTLVARKKYFNYKMDGLRALRAMKEIIMALVVPFSVTPIFFTT